MHRFLIGAAVFVAVGSGLTRADGLAQTGGPPPAASQATGAITGVVVDGATKSPIGGAIVYLSTDGRTPVGDQSRQMTDDKGRFAFVNVPPGTRYNLTANAFGYLDGAFGRENLQLAANAPIAVRTGEWVSNLRLSLWRPAAISGTVVDERGEPMAGVYVRAIGQVRVAGRDQLASGPVTTTNDLGAYRIAGLLPGRYLIEVPSVQASAPTKPLAGSTARVVSVQNGLPTQTVSLPPTSASPSIVAANEPALELDPAARLLLRNYPTPPAPSGGRRFAYPPTFHPSATNPGAATAIALAFGDERAGVDIALNAVLSWRVSGMVEGPQEALTNLTLRLLPEGLETLGQGSEAATALVDSDGHFVFLNVPGGTYVIDAPATINEIVQSSGSAGSGASFGPSATGFPTPPSRQSGWGSSLDSLDAAPAGTSLMIKNFRGRVPAFSGRTPLAVGRDEDAVIVRLRPAATISGRLTIEQSSTTPSPSNTSSIVLRLDPADGNPALGRPMSNQSAAASPPDFTIPDVLPGRYFLRTTSTGWLVKSISWQGRDYTDAPLDAAATQDIAGVQVTVTDAAPVLSGLVRDAQGAISSGAAVIVFPTDQTLWTNFGTAPLRVKQIASGSDGTYRATTLPAGEYYAIALDAAEGARWLESDFFAAASRVAARVSLKWGQPSTADLAISHIQ